MQRNNDGLCRCVWSGIMPVRIVVVQAVWFIYNRHDLIVVMDFFILVAAIV